MSGFRKTVIRLYEYIYSSDFIMPYIYRNRYKTEKLNIMNSEETIEYIIRNKCSVSRYGEGEIWGIIDSRNMIGFQKRDEKLAKELERVLCNNNKNLLICLPYALNNISGRTKHSRSFWFNWSQENNQHTKTYMLISKTAGINYRFGDTQISRPYMAYQNKKRASRQFSELKKIWEGRDVLIVEGKYTRLGVGNDILANTKSIHRILCPAENAFDKYESILTEIKKNYDNQLILIALGPTATVLASDLADYGVQAIDLGHIDIEYEWFLAGAEKHDSVEGKYVNEADSKNVIHDSNDEAYMKEIICVIE